MFIHHSKRETMDFFVVNGGTKRFNVREEEPPPKDATPGQDWRGDPQETYSDWRIIVINKDSAFSKTVYHVHKFVLSSGPRRSEYFAKVFKNLDHFQEGDSGTTKLELDALGAKAFPDVLDYLYHNDQSLHIETETATALHFLGEYMDIRYMRWDALQFCKNDISLNNASLYYEHAMMFQNETILGTLAKFLGENILDISPSSDILQISSPCLWINALEHSPSDDLASEHVSDLMAAFIQGKSGSLDLDEFRALTSKEKVPKVKISAALPLCAEEDRLDCSVDVSSSPDSLSTLQERCTESLSNNWPSFASPDEATVMLLRHRKPTFLAELLLKSCEKAHRKLMEMERELQKFHPVESRDYEIGKSVKVPGSLCTLHPNLVTGDETLVLRKKCSEYTYSGKSDLIFFYY